MANLEAFVQSVLVEIINGVKAAQVEVGEPGTVSPELNRYKGTWRGQTTSRDAPVHMVEFDVAVGTSESTATTGGVGVILGVLALGTKGESAQGGSSLSRIKFSVPIRLPEQPES